jgi:hypothetical protein
MNLLRNTPTGSKNMVNSFALDAGRQAMVDCLTRAENLDQQLWVCGWQGGRVQGLTEGLAQIILWQDIAAVAIGLFLSTLVLILIIVIYFYKSKYL